MNEKLLARLASRLNVNKLLRLFRLAKMRFPAIVYCRKLNTFQWYIRYLICPLSRATPVTGKDPVRSNSWDRRADNERLQWLPGRIFQNKAGNGQCDFRLRRIVYFYKAFISYIHVYVLPPDTHFKYMYRYHMMHAQVEILIREQ